MAKLPNIIMALDHGSDQAILAWLAKFNPAQCRVKIGSILFTRYGPSLLEKIISLGFSVFLDLKFHDIPQTVAGACQSAAALGVWMVNVHAAGGLSMMKEAYHAIQTYPPAQRPLLIAVTILTSLNEQDLQAIGYQDNPAEMVLRLARLAHQAGLDGVVCSAHEIPVLRANLPAEFLLVVPGIRPPADLPADDQKRVMTPQAAIAAGADYLVIGRPLTQAPNPQQVLTQILTEIHSITR
jgi:orotidine-5'-phosphate decarboxylase